MKSLRRLLASRANGARSHGPVTSQGKQRSSMNALRHGLLARCVVLENESREGFESLLGQHLDRLQPADGVEFGMIEEMVAACWRLRRAWAIETSLMENAAGASESSDPIERIGAAFTDPSAAVSLALLHRYESRLHKMYERSLHNLLLLRVCESPASGAPAARGGPELPNEPNPISGHGLLPESRDTVLPNDSYPEPDPSDPEQ
jgi:hypothetical protein